MMKLATIGGQDDDAPWPDSNETTSPERLAEEFDTAFASYTDARKRFNELKMARGFLLLVALTEQQQPLRTAASSSSSPTASSWQRKGKGKGGKNKGKGRGSSATIRYPPQGARKSDPKGRARANMTCLRCGQLRSLGCPLSTIQFTYIQGLRLETTSADSKHGASG